MLKRIYNSFGTSAHIKFWGMALSLTFIVALLYRIAAVVAKELQDGWLAGIMIMVVTLWSYMECFYPNNQYWERAQVRTREAAAVVQIWKDNVEDFMKSFEILSKYTAGQQEFNRGMMELMGGLAATNVEFEKTIQHLVEKDRGTPWIVIEGSVDKSFDLEVNYLLKHEDGTHSIGTPYLDTHESKYYCKMNVVSYMPIPL